MVPENIHTPPTRDWKFRGGGLGGGGGGSQRQCMKLIKLEFLEGWRGHIANPFHGGYGYFLEPHIIKINVNNCIVKWRLGD